ncbi:Soluble NSF attachment domain-containing proteinc SNAP43 [Phytophthora infestans]|uniref:Soluble NSF attachment domain-containing proteinc SNAP43 n=1 Tax=Phytophthora infestans TaxID=4787 RepID=A0A833SZ18_PHYIN|nr:Soluble NSF attachment domain-containing proteinc SNAP43 [Phytophthora infestans]
MIGDVAIGPTSPPLPIKPRATNRSRKQREREVPDVEWERSLQHFAAAVSDDFDDLHARFLQESEITFASWKRLWADARMSAAFHVEFWDSSPTNTHKTILQQALDALVCCIEEHNGAFESTADVAVLVSRVFALYCAYSVQLGDPKHKIDVDPQSWKALLTVNFVMCGARASLFPLATREVRALMHRLIVEEDAFLRCLQGFGSSVRVRNRAIRVQTAQTLGAGQIVLVPADNATEEDAPVEQNIVEQLKSFNNRYQELISRARPASVTGAGLSGSRAYVKYKANEEARRSDRIVRAAGAREYDGSRSILEQIGSKHDEHSNDLDLSDRDSVMSVPSSPTARAVVSIPRERGSSEDFMAELESELHADVLSEQVELDPAARNKQTSALSEVSEADSDGLADLEQELEENVGVASLGNVRKTAPKKSSPPARRKRGRPPANTCTVPHSEAATTLVPRRATAEKHSSANGEVSEAESVAFAKLERQVEQSMELVSSRLVTGRASIPPRRRWRRGSAAPGIVPRKAGRTSSSTQKPAHTVTVENARPTAKRARSDSMASTMPFADSWAVASTADSDGLAEIQAELDAIPTLAEALKTAPKNFSRGRKTHQRSSDATVQLPAAKPEVKSKVKLPTRQSSSRDPKRKLHAVDVVRDRQNPPGQSADQRTGRRTTALSILSDSSGVTAQSQAQVEVSGGRTTSRRTHEPITPYESLRGGSSRLSSVASEAGSNVLEELERELNATAATLGVAPSHLATAQTKATPRKRKVNPSSAQQTTRNNAKMQRVNRMDTSTSANGEQRVSKSSPKASRGPSQRSSVSLDTESDGWAELMAELDTTVASQTATAVTHRRALPTKRLNTSSTRKQSPWSPKVLAPHSAPSHSSPPPSPAATADLRRSARLSSLASDTESDGLEDLLAELESTPAASKPPVANTTQPRATRKLQTRAQGTLKAGQTKEGPKPMHLPRA